MAEPIQYTIQDMKDEIASLYLEVKARARREDELVVRIKQLEAQLAPKVAKKEK